MEKFLRIIANIIRCAIIILVIIALILTVICYPREIMIFMMTIGMSLVFIFIVFLLIFF